MNAEPFIRLDQMMVQRNHAPNRSRARDMVLRGCVMVNGVKASKPGQKVADAALITLDDPAAHYVSRAALKLVAGLEASGFSPYDKQCLDLGASTGGFTQVLVEQGAAHVMAIDVGHGQMVASIAQHPHVTCLEGLNAKHLTHEHFPQAPQFIVSDMSFISLVKGAEQALLLAAQQAHAILLIKPQFEVGRDGIGKGGLVNDEHLAQQAVERVCAWFNGLDGWAMTHLLPSPIKGGDGNTEYLLCGERHG